MKIGILTYHCSHNYGAFLQSYALANALKRDSNHSVEIIDFNMKCASKTNRAMINFNRRQISSVPFNYLRYRMFEKSRVKYLPLSAESLITDDLGSFSNFVSGKYDAIIVGSDEVWKLDGFRGFPNPYWLPSINNCRKISYAASSRTPYEKLNDDQKSKLKSFAADFSYIGVRDEATRGLINSAIGLSRCHMNCDPTFAFDFSPNPERGQKLLKEKYVVNLNKKVIGLMCGVPKLARAIIDNISEEYEIVSLYYYYYGTKGYYVPDPFEWIDIISALDALVTTFFHGMVFSIKCDTPFIAIENRVVSDLQSSKNYDILASHGLEKKCLFYFNGKENEISNEVRKFLSYLVKGKRESYSEVCGVELEKYKQFLIDANI